MSKNMLQIDNKIPIIAILGALATCLVYGVTTNTKVDNLKETTSLKLAGIESQLSLHQNTLDIRGHSFPLRENRINQIETDVAVSKNDIVISKTRIDKLELAIGNINDNVQKIADKVLNEKSRR
tara:strand:- start:129 stop:500 length:372 start_codon:yes stop_codon:yes gene_type:complete